MYMLLIVLLLLVLVLVLLLLLMKFFTQVNMLMFYDVQTTSLSFTGKRIFFLK